MQWVMRLLALVVLVNVLGCFNERTILPIHMAENIRKTQSGRVFVTASKGLYELKITELNDVEKPVLELVYESTDCDYFAGLAELHNWLFFVCSQQQSFTFTGLTYKKSGRLMAYSFEDASVKTVWHLERYQFANGIDVVPHFNYILLADENFFGKGGVSRLEVDFSGDSPKIIGEEYHWINKMHGVNAANGVRVVEDSIFLTDLGYVKQLKVDTEWQQVEAAEILFTRFTAFDDFDLYCNGLLVADYLGGKLTWVPLDGSDSVDLVTGLTSPSAVLTDSTPLFKQGDILFTESIGVLPNSGHRLALASLPPCT